MDTLITEETMPKATDNRCNLIVNYLPQSIKENDFNLLFSRMGPLKTCKLMFDKQTGYSFGYGFVEYVNEEDALKAIATFNGHQLEHKRLKVALARPNCEETKNTNLYIRNLPVSYDEQLLHDLFAQYGEVIQVRILRDQNTASSRRIGFIIMATKQTAQLAIQQLDNTIPPNFGTEPIIVKYADEEGKKRGKKNGNFRDLASNNMQQNNFMQHQNMQAFNFNNSNSFITGSTNQSGMNTLPNLGKMKTNRATGHQNRYNPISTAALINPGNSLMNSAASSCNFNPWNMSPSIQQPYSQFSSANQSNVLDIGNMQMETNKPNSLVNGHIIYVYGLGQANESDLYSLFKNCGRILRVNVIKNPKTGQYKGYGFVVFETYDEAYYAVHNMNGFIFNQRPLQVQLNAGHLD